MSCWDTDGGKYKSDTVRINKEIQHKKSDLLTFRGKLSFVVVLQVYVLFNGGKTFGC